MQKLRDLADSLTAPLPVDVSRRVRALKFLQHQRDALEKQFEAERLALEARFELLYSPLYHKRASIVKGEYEPVDEELAPEVAASGAATTATAATTTTTHSSAPPPAATTAAPATTTATATTNSSAPAVPVRGIPSFWLHAMNNHQIIGDDINDKDSKILEHLIDIRYENLPENTGFRLFFDFSPNEFMAETQLVKTYVGRSMDSEDATLEKCTGTQITWTPGSNPTIKTVTKTVKARGGRGGRGGGAKRQVTETVKIPSFFNFFQPPSLNDAGDDDSDEEHDDPEEAMEDDYTKGMMFKKMIIPKAVDWFTGDASLSDDEEDEDEEEDDDDDDDDDSDDDAGGKPKAKKISLKSMDGAKIDVDSDSDDEEFKPKKNTKKGGKPDTSKPPEGCKQQ